MRKEFRDYCDSMTIVFPLPKKLHQREQAKGFYIAGSLSKYSDRFYSVYSGDVPLGSIINQSGFFLGKKIDRKTLPDNFQHRLNHAERLWNRAVTEDTKLAWKEWNDFNLL